MTTEEIHRLIEWQERKTKMLSALFDESYVGKETEIISCLRELIRMKFGDVAEAADGMAASIAALCDRGALDTRSLPADALLVYVARRVDAGADSLNYFKTIAPGWWPNNRFVAALAAKEPV